MGSDRNGECALNPTWKVHADADKGERAWQTERVRRKTGAKIALPCKGGNCLATVPPGCPNRRIAVSSLPKSGKWWSVVEEVSRVSLPLHFTCCLARQTESNRWNIWIREESAASLLERPPKLLYRQQTNYSFLGESAQIEVSKNPIQIWSRKMRAWNVY